MGDLRIPTKDDVDSELVPPDKPGDAFLLVGFECCRDPDLGGVQRRAAFVPAIAREDELRCREEPPLVLHHQGTRKGAIEGGCLRGFWGRKRRERFK